MATLIPEEWRSDPPGCVLIYVPGSMQAFFDQSIGTMARQTTAACNLIAGTATYEAGNIEEARFTSGKTVQRTRIVNRRDKRQDIVVISADYTETLSETLKQSSIIMRFLRLFGFCISVLPLLYRIVRMTPRRGHSPLLRIHKGFLIGAYALVLVALTVAALAVIELAGSQSTFLVILTIAVAGLVPRKLATAISATGNEYYGLVRYLLKADKRAEIREYFEYLHEEVRKSYPNAAST